MLLSVLPKVRAGALAPEAFRVYVRTGNSGIDLTTVTGVTLQVRNPNGVEVEWAGTVAAGPFPPAVTPTDLWIVHPYAAGDVDVLGRYAVYAVLSIPGGAVRSVPSPFQVVNKFDP